MGNINCCQKPEEVMIIESKETINADNIIDESIQDKDEYPHDSEPAFRISKRVEEGPQDIEVRDSNPKNGAEE